MLNLIDTRELNIHWKICVICRNGITFKTAGEFTQHIRDFHCSKEGGSFVCKYGLNGVCSLLPPEGVNGEDYNDHVFRDHVYCYTGNRDVHVEECYP